MNILDKLQSLGFEAELCARGKGTNVTYRIRTSKGWTYEKFTSEDAVDAATNWAIHHEPSEVR